MKKTVKAWIAMNKGDFTDPQDASFYRTKADATKAWGTRQVIVPCTITYQVSS